MTKVPVPQSVKNSIGTLIFHALANATSVDDGYEYEGTGMHFVTDPDQNIGDWIVTIKRVRKPSFEVKS